jgi:glucose-1-phosphate cytidylyltransferase
MIVVILAGGLGTRLSEETVHKPKPLVKLVDKPILWHIMNIFASQIECEIKVATGYKSELIDEYLNSDFPNKSHINVIPFFTGENSQTSSRVKQIMRKYPNSQFIVTYGDGVSDIDLNELVKFHNSHGKLATVTAVHPASRFGRLELEGDRVIEFSEKPQTEDGWINGGFLVFEPEVINFLPDVDTPLEREPLMNLAKGCHLMAFKHNGFWHPMDTLREKYELEKYIKTNTAPWMKYF